MSMLKFTIHRLIENIRIMEDNTAIITLKGGYIIEEPNYSKPNLVKIGMTFYF